MVLVFSDCSQAVDSQRVIRMTPRHRTAKGHKKTLSSRLGRKGNILPWFHPHSTRRMQSPARHVLHSWPITDALRDSLPPVKAGRCRASGWYSQSSLPEMALSRWPSVAVGRRLLLVPLYAITIRTTFSISRREPTVKPVQRLLHMLHCYHCNLSTVNTHSSSWVYGVGIRSAFEEQTWRMDVSHWN